MRLEHALLSSTADDLRMDLKALRSAKALAGRRQRDRRAQAAAHERDSRRAKRRRERELDELLRIRVRFRVPPENRPRVARLMRRLRNDPTGYLPGEAGKSDARGRDGFYSIYFEFTARGLKTRSGRPWRQGEAKRAALYIIAEDGLETPEQGWRSNIGTEPAEIAAFMDLIEVVAREERANANVYISEIIALPAELTSEQRREVLADICCYFESRGLPYVAAPHKPSAAGDQRNFHAHIIYPRRPFRRLGPFEWELGLDQDAAINTPVGIAERRADVVACINRGLAAAGVGKRYTAAPRPQRGMGRGEAKRGQAQTAILRNLAVLEAKDKLLSDAAVLLSSAMDLLIQTSARMDDARKCVVAGLQRRREVAVPDINSQRDNASARCRAIQASCSPAPLQARLEARRANALAISHAADQRRRGEALREQKRKALDGERAARERLAEARTATVEGLKERRLLASQVAKNAGDARAAARSRVRPNLASLRRSAVSTEEGVRRSYSGRKARADAIAELIVLRDRVVGNAAQLAEDQARIAALRETARLRELDRKEERERFEGMSAEIKAALEECAAGVAEMHRRMGETWSILRRRIVEKLDAADPRPVIRDGNRVELEPSLLTPQERAFFQRFGDDLLDDVQKANKRWEQPQSREAASGSTPSVGTRLSDTISQGVGKRPAAGPLANSADRDPARDRAIESYAEFIRTSPLARVLRVDGRDLIDVDALPEDWRLPAKVFDEEPAVLAALKGRADEAEALLERRIISWAESRESMRVYAYDGRWHLNVYDMDMEDPELREAADQWAERPSLLKAYARIGEAWVREYPRIHNLPHIAQQLPGTELAAEIHQYLAELARAQPSAETQSPLAPQIAAGGGVSESPAEQARRLLDLQEERQKQNGR